MPSSRLRAQIHHSMALNFSRVSQSVMEPMLGERKVAYWIGSGEPLAIWIASLLNLFFEEKCW